MYEIRYVLNNGKKFSVGGYNKLDRVIDDAKLYSGFCIDTKIIYTTYDGSEVEMALTDAEAKIEAGSKLMRFS